MIDRQSLSGLILAGGRASRMQLADQAAVDKGLLELRGEPLVAHVRRYLEPRVAQVWVNANRHLDIYARYGTTISDDPALGAGLGPLAGVASALARVETPWRMVVPVDVPLLPADLVDRLAQVLAGTKKNMAYASAGGPHPLCMLLHRSANRSLLEFLREGGRKVQQWQQLNQAVEVAFTGDSNAFFNINTREDLCLAEQIAPAGPI